MDIEHSGLLSWVHERRGAPQKHKNHAQDGGTLIATRDQRPAILPWFWCFGCRPSFVQSRAPCPSRPAAELLLDVVGLSMIFPEKPISTLPQSCSCAGSLFRKSQQAIVNDRAKGAR